MARFDYRQAEKIFTLTTVHGKECLFARDFFAVSDWIRLNISGRWDSAFGTIDKNKVFAVSFAFENKSDAALFQLFWSDDIHV